MLCDGPSRHSIDHGVDVAIDTITKMLEQVREVRPVPLGAKTTLSVFTYPESGMHETGRAEALS